VTLLLTTVTLFHCVFISLIAKLIYLPELRKLSVCNTDIITSDNVETILSACHHSSVVVATKDTLGACNPTSKQSAMAHKLKPTVTIFQCNLNADTCKQIAILLASSCILNEIKLDGCNIGNIEVEILSDILPVIVQ